MTEEQIAADSAQESPSDIDTTDINFLGDVTLEIGVELGRIDLPVMKVVSFKKGSVIELDKLSGEPLDIRVNGRLMARGEAVIVNENFGIRVTQVLSPQGSDVI